MIFGRDNLPGDIESQVYQNIHKYILLLIYSSNLAILSPWILFETHLHLAQVRRLPSWRGEMKSSPLQR